MVPTLGREAEGFAPAFEVKETKDGFVFSADLPDVKEPDLEVRLSQNRLSVSGKRESEKTDNGDTFYTYERSYGSFVRTFTLPEGVDADRIKAELKHGVLTLEFAEAPRGPTEEGRRQSGVSTRRPRVPLRTGAARAPAAFLESSDGGNDLRGKRRRPTARFSGVARAEPRRRP